MQSWVEDWILVQKAGTHCRLPEEQNGMSKRRYVCYCLECTTFIMLKVLAMGRGPLFSAANTRRPERLVLLAAQFVTAR